METDYYDVLGIRPNAGLDEIELAYRGRRSQYHPDRYASADAETLNWATSKMKEVNEAYTALKDPAARDQADARRQYRPDPSARPEQPSSAQRAGPPPIPMTLRDALEGLELNNEPMERVFIAPHIPRKKLAGALESYGQGLHPKDVVVLIDDTFFGGAREGVLITENEIRCKAVLQRMESRIFGLPLQIVADGKHVYINDEQYIELNMPNKGDLKALFKAVTRYLQHNS